MKGILAAGLVCVAAALAACGGDNSNNGPQKWRRKSGQPLRWKLRA